MTISTADFLIIGGGIIGLNMALAARRDYPKASITLLEKEQGLGMHASGRNSGVLHAGFYYPTNSLKARFTRDGNKALTEFCLKNKLKINQCGKLVVAQNESDLRQLDKLFARGHQNGINIEEISENEARKIEPRVRTYRKALYSPTTSSIDPLEVLEQFRREAEKEKIKIHTNTKYLKKLKHGVHTNKGSIDCGYLINTAGLYADKIAKDFGFSKNHSIVPFKGLYLIETESAKPIKTHIYPVPDLQNPFLGVHFTVAVDGKVKLGPTAIPAFWREQYSQFDNFKPSEFFDIVAKETRLLIHNNFNFRNLA